MTINNGTISATEINTDFNAVSTALDAVPYSTAHDFSIDFDILDGASGLAEGQRRLEFVPPDDMQLVALGLTLWNPDATSRTATLTLTAVVPESDGEFTTVDKYVLNQTWSVSATTSSTAEVVARTAYTTATGDILFLLRGIRYVLTVTFSTASPSVITRTNVLMVCRNRWRRG